ncbi:hypothetical protein BX616_000955 [Lobosporangium transversale]|uniref:Uncharacterized protein n=1 Tax=Lobosporangium transversale TaxID=64571 RepID=A0A1Y2GDN4_9FUNG|nr:hypothetical protein BCR41DRAFT_359720 [Lobosporangium transversale]KAF9905676.1 hypothetical protein BX616_000955 [Lobosporangium transversale]ORZ07970.1 hypothetical protein BCR41DRAFT_359720 [Lobosporangium transversale]|eukprot:XP_021878204.1 hypothetical protein BCR41DRAFT_359720 [Lobosporangium transversale]
MESIPSSFDHVFSIPELATHVGQYLRPFELRTLSLLSRTLFNTFRPSLRLSISSLTFTSSSGEINNIRSTSIFCPQDISSLAPRTRALKLDLHHEDDCPKQTALLDTVFRHWGSTEQRRHLSSLHIEYWGNESSVLHKVIVNIPMIQDLSVTFMAAMEVNVLPNTLIDLSKTMGPLALKTLILESRIQNRSKYIGWSAFTRMLQACPDLQELNFKNIPFAAVDMRGDIENDDVIDEDNSENADIHNIKNMDLKPQFMTVTRSFPSMNSLKFWSCTITMKQIVSMDKLFPRLQKLEVRSNTEAWTEALTKHAAIRSTTTPSTSTNFNIKQAIFQELKSLTIWIEHQSGRIRLMDLVQGRPYLTSLRTDLLPTLRNGLLEFAEYCSSLNNPSPGSTTETTDTSSPYPVANAATNVRHKFKRLAIQTYASPPMSTEALERFYGASCFQELEYIFIQARPLTMNLFPFARTLKSLELGGHHAPMNDIECTTLNEILQRLPALENLRIERYLENYSLFSGLGFNDGPFLHELKVYIYHKAGNAVIPQNEKMEVFDLDLLERQVLERFRLLERLKLGVHRSLSLPEPDVLKQWRGTLWEKRGCKIPQIDFVVRYDAI